MSHREIKDVVNYIVKILKFNLNLIKLSYLFIDFSFPHSGWSVINP